MEVREFVRETLLQITSGVNDAKSRLNNIARKKGVKVPGSQVNSYEDDILSEVEFDILVTVETSGKVSAEGKAGIKMVASVEGVAEVEQKRGHEHRVKFSVPVQFT